MFLQGFNGLDLFIIIGFVYISYILIKILVINFFIGFSGAHADDLLKIYSERQPMLIEPLLNEFESQTGIDVDSNVIVKFNQTMNVDSIVINATDSTVGSENIILSYDSNFANCIPLQGDFSSSNNDTTFEFKPLILSNTSLQLTQDKNLFCKVIRTIKIKVI